MPKLYRSPAPLVVLSLAIVFVNVLTGCAKPQFKQGPKWAPNPRQAPPPPPAKDMPISPELQSRATGEIEQALRSDDPLIRAHAIESLKTLGGEGSNEAIIDALSDPQAIVRFSAAMATGERKIAAAKTKLLNLVEDPDPSVQIAVRYALHRLGDYRHSLDLETFAAHPQASLRADTAMVLGLLGEPTGLAILRDMDYDRDPAVLLQVAEAQWRLGSMEGLEKLVAASQSAYTDYQMVAVLALAGPRDQRVTPHITAMLTAEHIEVQLAAARAMGMLGSDAGYTIAANATREKDPRIQLLAAMALAEMGRNDAQVYLQPLLESPDNDVRLAAAAALIRLCR